MSKAKKPSQSRNLSVHNYQTGKATGNRDDSLKSYNFDVLAAHGMETVQNYNKYVKQHMHVGYKAHKEELEKGDFVLPRDGSDITKVESIIVSPDVKVPLKDIKNFDFSELMLFFDDYIFEFLKKDSKFKDIKILSAKVHRNEVFYPRFKEVEEDGKKKLVKLSKKESCELAYIKPHMHIDYIPLVEAEKDGVKYLKCSSKELWRAEKGRYFDSFREYNDRMYEAIGKAYGLDRGQKWEEWDVRVQKKNNGQAVKKTIRLSEWQILREEDMNARYVKQLEEDRKKYSSKSEEYKKLTTEIEKQQQEKYSDFLEAENEYKKKLEQMQESIKLSSEAAKKAEEKRKKEMKETDEVIATTTKLKQQEQQLQREVNAKIFELMEEKKKYEEVYANAAIKYSSADAKLRTITRIEIALQEQRMTKEQAVQEIKKENLVEDVRSLSPEAAPELSKLSDSFIDDDNR